MVLGLFSNLPRVLGFGHKIVVACHRAATSQGASWKEEIHPREQIHQLRRATEQLMNTVI